VVVTSKELKYMMVQSRDVGVGKLAMPQAIRDGVHSKKKFTMNQLHMTEL
jgi:hypothetical protein